MSSQARSSGVKNDNIPVRIIAFARIRRLNCECYLGDVFEHPGPPNRWRRGPQAHPKEAKRAPRDTEEQPRAPEMRPREPPRTPKRKPREPSTARRPNVSKESTSRLPQIVLPPRRGYDFRCQRRGEAGSCPERERLTPYVRRSLSAWEPDPTCRKIHEKNRDLARPTFYSNFDGCP